MLAGFFLVVGLGAGTGAQADTPCPSPAGLNTADWRVDRAAAEALRDDRFMKTCHGRGAAARSLACADVARSRAASQAAWRAALEDFRRLIDRVQQGDCQPAVDVPAAPPGPTVAR